MTQPFGTTIHDNGVAELIFNHPPVNAFDSTTWFAIASEIEAASQEAPPATLLERLSDRYDLCCYGLREIRRQWESGGDEEIGPNTILLN